MRRGLFGGLRLTGLRLTGLRLVVVALSAVGLITTSAALELFRFGELASGINQNIDATADRQRALFALAQAVSAVALHDTAQTRTDLAAVLAADLARASDAVRLTEGAGVPEGAGLPDLPDLTDLTDLPNLSRTVGALAQEAAARLDTDTALWGKASASLSQVLSLLLGSIVVLLFTVMLRMLAYLSARDRTEADLRRATAEAKAANAAKSDFLATISHEIRTPLTAIRGYADLLAAGPLSHAQRDQLDRLRDANGALGVLIDDILDLSKIEAGRIDLHAAPFDVAALLDRVIGLLLPVAQAKGLALTGTLAAEVPRYLAGDGARLMQVVLNLTNNAVKFTPAGQVTVAVGRRGDLLEIAVTDSGIGIAPGDIPKLFKRFSQIDSSLSRAHAGTGLGLAISRGLVERMGGRITVQSEVGTGTTFAVTLPLVAATAPAPVPQAAAITSLRRGARILVIEDSAPNQDLIQAVLQRDGHVCVAAFDGVDGVAAARAGGFDLVIMDMQMPRMDGIAATKAIRALPAPMGAVPILALSANALDHQVAAMCEAGADAHLAKPFAIAALSQQVQGLIAARTAEVGAGEVGSPEVGWATEALPEATGLAEIDALVGLLGRDWVRAGLARVAQSLSWLDALPRSDAVPPVPPPLPPVELRRKAHRLVSDAGQLGLSALSDAAARLQEAVDAGADPAAPLGALMHEAALARATLPRLTAYLDRG